MPRALYFGFAIVAAFQLPAAAASVEDVPISRSVVALADRLGVDLSHNRAYFISDIARLLYASADAKPQALLPARDGDETAGDQVTVPIPLSSALWSRVIFRRTVPPSQLV